jgi:translation initiation factor 3 subunit A
MKKYIELCIDLQHGRHAKDGLHQYKNIAGTTAVASLETVIRFYISSTQERVNQAKAQVGSAQNEKKRKKKREKKERIGQLFFLTLFLLSLWAQLQASQAQMEDIDDLEASETPESLLLAAVSDEGDTDRAEKSVLTPWLKFLWEAFRTVLDILRNNPRLEHLYQDIAKQTFVFCQTFGSGKKINKKICIF